MKKMYLRRNGKRMAAFVANGQPDPRDFPARVCGHRIHGSGEIIPRKEGARPTAICRLRLAHERVIIPAVGFPNSEGDAGIYLGSETDHQRFWIRGGRSAPRMTTVYAFSSKSLTNKAVRLIAFSKSTHAYISAWELPWLPAVDFAAFQPHGRVAA